MVYVQDGKVLQKRPWGLKTITDFLWRIIFFIIYFFKTLTGLDSTRTGSNNGSRSNNQGNEPGGPSGGPRGPRTLRHITTIEDSSMPGCGCSR